MGTRVTASDELSRCFLDVRSRVIDIASALDRIDRGINPPEAHADHRWKALADALCILNDGKPDRAGRIQLVFSDHYEPGWRASFAYSV